jgi:methyltransferase (TIGR00027 family)
MRKKSSFTAAAMALQRALESNRPLASRLFDDPYAIMFTHGGLRILARASRIPLAGRLAPLFYDVIAGPGPRSSAVVRTRFIDDVLDASASEVSQCVLLGAGFDTRPHRLASLAGLCVYEVDHPATQERKRSVIERLGLTSSRVVYVPVDFERDSLEAGLLAAGFDPHGPTLFVWEGVTNYLHAESVSMSLRTIRRLTVAASTLVFTYVHAGVLDGSAYFPEAARWLRNVERAGEPWTFGLLPEDLGIFLRDRGWTLESDVTTREAGDRWLPLLGRRDRASALYRIAVARSGPCPG